MAAHALPRSPATVRERLRSRLTARRREQLAAGVERAIAAAGERRSPLSSAIPVQRIEVLATAPLLHELAARLRDEQPVSPYGLARVRRLLTDGCGPLFAPSAPGALWDEVERAILELDHGRTRTS